MDYFIIYSSSDGAYMETCTEQVLLERLNEDYWGPNMRFLSSMPLQSNPNNWGECVVIIKGEIKTPKPIEVVTTYTI